MEITIFNTFLYGLLSSIPLIYWYLTRNFNYWSKIGIKGPRPLPLLGTMLYQFRKPRVLLSLEWAQKYGKLYGIYNGNKPLLVVSEPELIKQICVKDFHIFTDRSTNPRPHPILSKHLLTLTGDDWKRVRSVVTPTFSSGKMKKMYPMIRQCLKSFMNELEVYAKDSQVVNVKTMYGNYTMDVISTCAFGTKTNTYKDQNDPFVQNAQKVFDVNTPKLLLMAFLPKFMLKLLNLKSGSDESVNEFFFNITRHIMKDRINSPKKYNDFIELLMKAQKNGSNNSNNNTKSVANFVDENDANEAHHVNDGVEEKEVEKQVLSDVKDKFITEEELLAQSWIFFIAGYETTATALTWASYELALNQSAQQRLYEEIQTSLDSSGEIDYDLLSKLPYLDAVISETLRLQAPATFLVRQASEDYKLGDTGITLKKGQQLEIPITAIHRSAENYENPNQFIPERFLPENRHQIKPYTYLPFGAGPRNCVGMRFALMEAKLALAHVIRKYKFVRTHQTEVPQSLNISLAINSPTKVMVGIQMR